jgi:hypothetical protein
MEPKQYIYIIQASLEPSKCKIGKTNNLERGKYLFACEVKDI